MKFWKGKKVLLTGHTGFKGSWLSLWLRELGADVSGISLPAGELSLFNLAGIEDTVTSYYCDITQYQKLLTLVEMIKPEIVFHLAAQALVKPSYGDPVGTYATNIMGTVHLLDAVRECGSATSIVIVTSDKCYENLEWPWAYRETDILGGKDPYSCSKACAELVVTSYRHSFLEKDDIGVATARAGNVIGGGDWGEDRLLPDLLSAFSGNKQVVIRNPQAIRPWQHVCESLNGYLRLGRKLSENKDTFAQAWNFGPPENSHKTVSWVADYVQAQWPNSTPWVVSVKQDLPESLILKLDNSKARLHLGWRPVLEVSQALDWTVEWHRAMLSKNDMKQITIKQIEDFMELVEDDDDRD